jgi:uncharacterized protein YndB with AHSA1/START domain
MNKVMMQTNHLTNYRTVIKAPVTKVWEALTDPAIVKRYFFGSNLETDWKVGSPLYFKGEYDGKSYRDKGVVQEFIPYKKLSYTYLSDWSGLQDTPENYLLVTYTVNEVPEGTELTVSQTNYDKEKAEHSEANWKSVIDGLKQIVE